MLVDASILAQLAIVSIPLQDANGHWGLFMISLNCMTTTSLPTSTVAFGGRLSFEHHQTRNSHMQITHVAQHLLTKW